MKFVKKTDLLIIGALLIIGLGVWLYFQASNANRPAKAEIYYQSQLVKTIYLTEGTEATFSIPQKPHVIFHQYPDKSICFEVSDCPDQICVRTGHIGRVGENAACLPNEIIMKIVAAGNGSGGEADAVIG